MDAASQSAASPSGGAAAAIAAGDRNQTAYFRHLAGHAVGGVVDDTDRYLFFAGGHDYPGTYTNGVIRKRADIGAVELLARAEEFFAPLGRSYVIWVRAHADADIDVEVRRRGWWARPPEEGNPCILLTAPLAPLAVPAGFRLDVAATDADHREYLQLVARGYDLEGADDALAQVLLFSLDSLRGDNVVVLLARDERDGKVRAGISAFLAEGCVGVEWTVTDPEVRGRGLGSVLMQRASAWGFERGADYAWGIASQRGISVWTRMGFSSPTRYRRYVAPAPSRAVPPVDRAARSTQRGISRRTPGLR